MANAFQSGFMVFHGNRLEDLRDLTVGLFKNNPLPHWCQRPFWYKAMA
jgi:exodeoxyribonuclease V gamma subunit